MFFTIRSWSTLKQKRLKCKIWEWGLQTRCSLVQNADDEVEDDVLLRNLNTENLIMTVSCFILTPANPSNPIQSTFIALDCVQGAARGGARASLPFLHFGEHQWFITLDPYPNIIIPTPYPLLSICLTNPNRELSHSGKEATDPGLLQEHWLLKHLRLSLIPHSNSSQPLNNDLQFTRLLCLKLLPFFSGLLKVNQNRWQEICNFFCGLHSINRWKGRHLWKLLIERIDFVLSQICCITTYNIPNSKHE